MTRDMHDGHRTRQWTRQWTPQATGGLPGGPGPAEKRSSGATWSWAASAARNSAEHSLARGGHGPWSLADHAPQGTGRGQGPSRMLMVHDVHRDRVRGHLLLRRGGQKRTWSSANGAAADRIFGLLPDDQAAELRGPVGRIRGPRGPPEARFAKRHGPLPGPVSRTCTAMAGTWSPVRHRPDPGGAAHGPGCARPRPACGPHGAINFGTRPARKAGSRARPRHTILQSKTPAEDSTSNICHGRPSEHFSTKYQHVPYQGEKTPSLRCVSESCCTPLGLPFPPASKRPPRHTGHRTPRVWRAAIFVHGCFWHMHEGCKTRPRDHKTHKTFWDRKLKGNKNAGRKKRLRNLKSLGTDALSSGNARPMTSCNWPTG